MLNSQSRPLNCLARAARTDYRKRSDKARNCSSDINTCLWRWSAAKAPFVFGPHVALGVRERRAGRTAPYSPRLRPGLLIAAKEDVTKQAGECSKPRRKRAGLVSFAKRPPLRAGKILRDRRCGTLATHSCSAYSVVCSAQASKQCVLQAALSAARHHVRLVS